MDPEARFPTLEHLPFYITAPGETDILLGAVALTLVAVVIGFGALYFTIQAIPDRIARGTSKVQMQLVGLLGLISLFTMNNLYWIIAILLAAVRIPDFITPLNEIAASLKRRNAEMDHAGPAGDAEPVGPGTRSPGQGPDSAAPRATTNPEPKSQDAPPGDGDRAGSSGDAPGADDRDRRPAK